MKGYLIKPTPGQSRWGMFTNLDSKVDRQALGVTYLMIHTPWRVLEVYL